MQAVVLNNVINKETKYYGLKLLGLIGGGILGLLAMIIFNMTVGIMASVVGFSLGSWVSTLIHTGILQRKIYWYLPSRWIFRGKYLPPSHIRKFM